MKSMNQTIINSDGNSIDIEKIKQLTSDESKAKYLSMIKDEWERFEIVQSMTTDEAKEKCLSMLSDDQKFIIIKNMSNDEIKESHLDEFQESYKAKIIESMSIDGLKESYLDEITNGNRKARIVQSMITDEAKERCMSKIDDYNKKKVIMSMTTDEAKDRCIGMIDEESFLIEYEKVELILTLQTDEAKERWLSYCNEDNSAIIASMNSDKIKKQYLEKCTNDSQIVTILTSMNSDELKESYLHKIKNENLKSLILSSMSNDKIKETYLGEIKNGRAKRRIISSLATDEAKERHLMELPKAHQIDLITRLNSDTKKIKYAITLSGSAQAQICKSLKYENFLENYKGMELEGKTIYRNNLKFENASVIKENLELFITSETQGMDIEETKKILEEMEKSNEEVLVNINFNILKSPYLETLGIDKINTLSCFKDVQEQLLNMKPEEYDIFFKCLDYHMDTEGTEHWNDMCALLLENIGEYSDLINDLQGKDYDIDKLYNLLQNPNTFKITTLKELEKSKDIIKQKCEEYIHDDNIGKKREAVLQKIFGQSQNEIKQIIKQYGKDIDTIENEDLKDYIKSIQAIMKAKPVTLEKIFEEVDEQEVVNKLSLQRNLKKEFAKQYNDGLFQVDTKNERVIIIPNSDNHQSSEFKMILTSIGAFVREGGNVNEKENWNRKSLASPHFCTSYVRNDMLGTAPIHSFCYGFNEMSEDSLVLSGPDDFTSSGRGLTSKAENDTMYYSPDTQINETNTYNEMDFLRIQEGQRKQPDYIIVFKKNGEIQNMEQALQTSNDWGKMPIVIIDVDEILRQERIEVEELQEKYEENPNLENAKRLYYKVRNNRVTVERQNVNLDETFAETDFAEPIFGSTVDLDDLKKQIEEKQESTAHKVGEVQIEDYEGTYSKISASDRKKEVSMMHRIYERVKEVQNIDNEERN